MQQSASNLSIGTGYYRLRKIKCQLAWASSFTAWLPSHAGLVTSLQLVCFDQPDAVTGSSVVQQLMTHALEHCCTQQAAAAAAHAVLEGSTACTSAPAPQPLRLVNYYTDNIISPGMFKALAACSSLNKLEIGPCDVKMLTTPICASLGRLTTLQSLTITVGKGGTALPDYFASCVAPLQRLTKLCVHSSDMVPVGVLASLPSSLKGLRIHVLDTNDGKVDVQLAHVKCLRELDVTTSAGITAASALPAGLTRLAVHGPIQGVSGLQQLVALKLFAPQDSLGLLHTAAMLPALRQLSALVTGCEVQEVQQVVKAVCTCSQIVELELVGYDDDMLPTITADGELLRDHLLQLPRLQALVIGGMDLVHEDWLGLTRLTGLTSLSLKHCSDLTELVAVSLALRMPHLSHLALNWCTLDNGALWPALAACTNLVSLSLLESQLGVTGVALSQLAHATQLTYLELCSEALCDDVNDVDVQRFLAGMPKLRSIDWV